MIGFSFFLFDFGSRFIFLDAGGAGGTDETGTNKDTHQLPVISMGTLIDVPASVFMSIFCNGTWLTQEPPRRFQKKPDFQCRNLNHKCH